MPPTDCRFAAATAALGRSHAADPTGEAAPYHQAVLQWVTTLAPDASDALRLAAQAQHIERWTIPRDRYPIDRDGYRTWRAVLSKMHAERAGQLLLAAGYDEVFAARVGALIRKHGLRRDPEAGLLQDAVCLTFVARQLEDFADGRDPDQVVRILAKTWAKMTPRGHAAARELSASLPPRAQALLARALEGPKPEGPARR